MSKLLWNALKIGPLVLGALLVASSTKAAEIVPEAATDKSAVEPATSAPVDTSNLQQVQKYGSEGTGDNPVDQITNASQFRDVQPSDWAYEALDRIVQKYGCLVGYPDGTYRGNRALSRYEFAAGLNACLRQIETLITNQPQNVSRTDFESLQRLSEEFRTELETLGTRVDKLEARTAFLENHQFSTTTKLVGEVVISMSDVFGSNKAVASNVSGRGAALNSNAILDDRVRLNFDSSFTGQDRLRTRLQARNITPFNTTITGTNETRLGVDGNENNNVELSRLQYRFPLGSVANVYVEATGFEYNDDVPNFNPYLEASGTGSISRFGRFNPIYYQANGGTGVVFDGHFSKQIGLALGYATPGQPFNPTVTTPQQIANNPQQGFGLFNGSETALAQLAFRPIDGVSVGLTYIHSYYNALGGSGSVANPGITASTGSANANAPFGGSVATSANNYGVEASLRLSPRFVISGWGGFTNALAENGSHQGARADIWNYAVTLAFPDFGKKGNLLGIVAGAPPRVAGNDISGHAGVDRNVSYHLEGFYRYRVTNNIDVTPGVFAVFNPEDNVNNKTLYVGTLRTTFSF